MSGHLAASLLGLLAGCASLAPAPGQAGDMYESPVRQVNATVGGQLLDDPAWGDLDEPYTVGVDYTEDWNSQWLFLEGGLHYAYDSVHIHTGDTSIQTDISFFDFTAGLLLQWPAYRAILRPYVGAGGALIFADADVEGDTDHAESDATFAGYVKVGILVPVSYQSHVGVEVRALDGGIVSTDVGDASVDSVQVALVFGASF